MDSSNASILNQWKFGLFSSITQCFSCLWQRINLLYPICDFWGCFRVTFPFLQFSRFWTQPVLYSLNVLWVLAVFRWVWDKEHIQSLTSLTKDDFFGDQLCSLTYWSTLFTWLVILLTSLFQVDFTRYLVKSMLIFDIKWDLFIDITYFILQLQNDC